jgi:tRNA pseudouridine55 synthase
MGRRRKSRVHGVLVIDKPAGITSHDVVARVRRAFDERRVGHAGTLDPMATGVLVVMLGLATKLAPFLTAQRKHYLATVRLGTSTDTLDAEGDVIGRCAIPDDWRDDDATRRRVEEALAHERQRSMQAPPVYSAIKVAGRAAYDRVRAGEQVELDERPVCVHRLELTGVEREPPGLTLALEVAKGYYVRSLARDLSERLGIDGHLCALRRTASGSFGIDQAVKLDGPTELPRQLLSVEQAVRLALPIAQLDVDGTRRAGHGGPLALDDFTTPPPQDRPCAWLDPAGKLVAIGELRDGIPAVLRGGFAPPA